MSLTAEEVKKIAHLARLTLSEHDMDYFRPQLSSILDFVAQMDGADTTAIEAMAHAQDLPQRLRPDVVTEVDERASFQALAPAVKVGLYLVPKVIEEA